MGADGIMYTILKIERGLKTVDFLKECIAKGYDLDNDDLVEVLAGNFDNVRKANETIPDDDAKQVLKDAGLTDIETSPGAGKSCGMPPDDKPAKHYGWTVEDDHPVSAFVDQPKGGFKVQGIPRSLDGLAGDAKVEWYKRFAQLVKDGVYIDSRNEIKVQLITKLIEDIRLKYSLPKQSDFISAHVDHFEWRGIEPVYEEILQDRTDLSKSLDELYDAGSNIIHDTDALCDKVLGFKVRLDPDEEES